MKLAVKTLKGEKFEVDVEPSNTVAEVKVIIETARSALPAANMRLIHSGKILKDADTIESCNIKPNAFLVVMTVKAKKTAPAAAPATAPAPKSTETSKTAASASTTTESTSTPAPASSSAAETSTSTSTATTPAAAPSSTTTTSSTTSPTETASGTATDSFPAEMVTNLTAMGFPEAEVRACLRASQGNPDVAVEFLMNGIPPAVQQMQQAAASTSGGAPAGGVSSAGGSSSGGSGAPLDVLRNHPQINQLRRLVQTNPSSLQAVLTQIGQQQPELLQEINGNQALFLEIMNEPVQDDAPPAPSSTSSTSTAAPSSSSSSSTPPSGSGGQGLNAASAAGMLNNPAQMAEMLQNMSPAEMQSLAGMMGFTPDQLSMTAQMISQMPPEQLQQYMNAAMQGGDMSGLMGAGGAGGGGGGQQVLELSQEEMAAVDRLADMGFDRAEAAQAYLACDKNEALAANLLMDGGFGFGDADMGGGSSGGAGGNNGNDGDDMYD